MCAVFGSTLDVPGSLTWMLFLPGSFVLSADVFIRLLTQAVIARMNQLLVWDLGRTWLMLSKVCWDYLIETLSKSIIINSIDIYEIGGWLYSSKWESHSCLHHWCWEYFAESMMFMGGENFKLLLELGRLKMVWSANSLLITSGNAIHLLPPELCFQDAG